MTTNSPKKTKPTKLPKTSPAPKPPKSQLQEVNEETFKKTLEAVAEKIKKTTAAKVKLCMDGDHVNVSFSKNSYGIPTGLLNQCDHILLVFKDQSGVAIAGPVGRKQPKKPAKK